MPGAEWSPGQPGMPEAEWPPVHSDQPPVADQPYPLSAQPDWEAMADRSAAERRKKRLWMLGGGVTVLALLAGGGTFFYLNRGDDANKNKAVDKPAASASPSPGTSTGAPKPPADMIPTVEGDPTMLRDRSGTTGVKMTSDASAAPVAGKRYELRLKGTANSYAQAAAPTVDVSKSFTVSARVYNTGTKGPRMAISQGDGSSFSFELGLDDVNGKQAWVFRVQTGDKGAAATTKTVSSKGIKTLRDSTTLTGSYDAEKKTITLYVEGKKAGETEVSGIWAAPGPLQLGRARQEAKWTGSWRGAMNNVQIYEAALTPEQATAQAKGKADASLKATHSWLII